MDSDNRLIPRACRRSVAAQLAGAAFKVLSSLNDWRDCECKHDQYRCEYVVLIFHVIYFPSCFGLR
jgi:hypothetical protein